MILVKSGLLEKEEDDLLSVGEEAIELLELETLGKGFRELGPGHGAGHSKKQVGNLLLVKHVQPPLSQPQKRCEQTLLIEQPNQAVF